jgi:nucleotide-binding universal stress UspA family protein
MKTIIVPTDFSDTAYNAAHYAIGLAQQMGTTRIVLYHAYELILPIPDVPVTVPVIDINEIKQASLEGLKKMKATLAPMLPDSAVIDYRAENNLLPVSIDQVCREEKADVIVMGITGGGGLEEVLIGSNTVDVVKHTTCPVIIVPPQAVFKPIKTIVFACDLRKVAETTPIQPLKKLLNVFKATLHVINIDHESKHFSTDTPFETMMLETLLEDYQPEYHFIDNPNVVKGIVEFAEKENADLLLTIPKKHGLFESIFKRSRTSQLAFHTHIPLLTIHE